MSGSPAARVDNSPTIGDDGVGQRRQQRQVEGGGDVDHASRRPRPLDEPVGGGLLDRRARPGHLDQPHRPLGAPHHAPGLAEGATRAAAFLERTPRHADRRELVQQMRASQAVGGAQVELDHTLVGLGLESRRALTLGEIARQGNLRGTIGNGTDRVPDHEPSLDQGEPTHHGVGGVEHLVEPGPRTAAHHRQGVGHARGGDQVIGRRLQVGLTQHARGFDEEPGDAIGAGVPEHVLVPAGAAHAGAVAAGAGEPGIRPRHPTDPDLDLREGAQRRRVDRRRVFGGVERRHVPRPAHDDDHARDRP